MWRLLFPLRTGGFHFRKQAPIGPYTIDFACHHARIAIEIDGDTHGTPSGIAADRRRDAFLSAEGYNVLRFSNLDVMRNPEGVFSVVLEALGGRALNRRSAEPSPELSGGQQHD
jgi:very-short-patch-repair endonuclease